MKKFNELYRPSDHVVTYERYCGILDEILVEYLVEQGKKLYSADTDSGEKWHIYHTDRFYCKFYWRKGKCSVPNKSVYRFDATRGIKGNKEKLINLLKTDELAYLKFKKN